MSSPGSGLAVAHVLDRVLGPLWFTRGPSAGLASLPATNQGDKKRAVI